MAIWVSTNPYRTNASGRWRARRPNSSEAVFLGAWPQMVSATGDIGPLSGPEPRLIETCALISPNLARCVWAKYGHAINSRSENRGARMPSRAPDSRKPIQIASPDGSVPRARAPKPHQSASVFPFWLRLLPKSAFPIRSQEDLANKVSSLVVNLSTQRSVTPGTGHELPARPQPSGRKKNTAS